MRIVIVVLIAVGLPAFIFFSIFTASDVPHYQLEKFEEFQAQLQDLGSPQYRLHSVQDDGGILRVNIVFTDVASDRGELERKTRNALYDVQSRLGKSVPMSVWAATEIGSDLNFEGFTFYSPNTNQTVFKSANDLQ